MEPGEFTLFCRELKSISRMLASPVDKDDLSQYLDMKRIFEKSLVTARPVQAGSVAALTHITFKKPGDGIRAAEYRRFLGRRFRRNLPADHKLTEADFE
jgi:sialic acid synthase SpsE